MVPRARKRVRTAWSVLMQSPAACCSCLRADPPRRLVPFNTQLSASRSWLQCLPPFSRPGPTKQVGQVLTPSTSQVPASLVAMRASLCLLACYRLKGKLPVGNPIPLPAAQRENKWSPSPGLMKAGKINTTRVWPLVSLSLFLALCCAHAKSSGSVLPRAVGSVAVSAPGPSSEAFLAAARSRSNWASCSASSLAALAARLRHGAAPPLARPGVARCAFSGHQ